MNLVQTVEALVDAGASPEMILAVVRRHEAAREVAANDRRAKEAERKRHQRAAENVPGTTRDNAGQAGTTADSAQPSPHVGERSAQVVGCSSSLRSEGNPPVKPKGLTAPKGAETARGTRLPEDWSPPVGIAGEFGLTYEQYLDQVERFRDYWRAVPGAKGRKADWPATWRNWLRRAAENSARKAPHERPHHDPKFDARQANLARALAGADSAAGRSWKP